MERGNSLHDHLLAKDVLISSDEELIELKKSVAEAIRPLAEMVSQQVTISPRDSEHRGALFHINDDLIDPPGLRDLFKKSEEIAKEMKKRGLDAQGKETK